MKKRVCSIGVSALIGLLACSETGTGPSLSGSSFETENSVAIQVQLADKTPAAHMAVRVRPSSFIATDDNLLNPNAINDSTDENGRVFLSKLNKGNYRVEVMNDSLKGSQTFIALDSSKTEFAMVVQKPGKMEGIVELKDGQKFAYVAIEGLDYIVQTDSLGYYEFESLPAGNFNVVALNETQKVVKMQSSRIIENESSIVDFITPAILPNDTIPEIPEDTIEVYPEVLLEDFNDGTEGWYLTLSEFAHGSLEAIEDEERGGVAYFKYSNDSIVGWTGIGRYLGNELDLSAMDSVEFYAKGVGRVSISFDYLVGYGVQEGVMVDSVARAESGKAWAHFDLDSVWKRFVVPVDSFVLAEDANGGNIGWDSVKTHITNITIFGNPGEVEGDELWVDDIKLFGVKPEVFEIDIKE